MGRLAICTRTMGHNIHSSEEFREFAKQFEFEHVTSSPHYPRSNGIAERHVRTVKELLHKCGGSSTKFHLGLRALRSTPVDAALPSPAELLFGRNIDALPKTVKGGKEEHRTRLELRQTKQLENHNSRIRRPLNRAEFEAGDRVFIHDRKQKTWQPGVLIDRHKLPASYMVAPNPSQQSHDMTSSQPCPDMTSSQTGASQVLRRTRTDIRRDPGVTVTRSGRVSRPPARYGSS